MLEESKFQQLKKMKDAELTGLENSHQPAKTRLLSEKWQRLEERLIVHTQYNTQSLPLHDRFLLPK